MCNLQTKNWGLLKWKSDIWEYGNEGSEKHLYLLKPVALILSL